MVAWRDGPVETGGPPGAPTAVAHVGPRAQAARVSANGPSGPIDPCSLCTFANPPLNVLETNPQYNNTIHVSHGFALGTLKKLLFLPSSSSRCTEQRMVEERPVGVALAWLGARHQCGAGSGTVVAPRATGWGHDSPRGDPRRHGHARPWQGRRRVGRFGMVGC